jgi:predicted RNase H-like HicB family nuclease
MKYLIVIEPTQTGFSAYSPDLPGCVSTGQTWDEVERSMHEAIEFHLEGLRSKVYVRKAIRFPNQARRPHTSKSQPESRQPLPNKALHPTVYSSVPRSGFQ